MIPTRRTRLAGAISVMFLLTACGSRADFSALDNGSVANGSGETATQAGPSGTQAAGGSTGSTGAGGTGGLAGQVGSGSSGGSVAPGPRVAGGSSGGSTFTSTSGGSSAGGPAANKAPIRLVYIIQQTAGVSALTGSADPGNSDQSAVDSMNALVSYANAHGGVGGRKISATGVPLQATSRQPDRLATCKHITEDLHAQVVLDQNEYLSEDGWSCFAQHKANYYGTVTATDRRYLKNVSPYVSTTWLAVDRSMKAMVAGARQTGFYKGQKVGILLGDEPTLHRLYDTVLKPALVAVGVTDPQVRYISDSDSSSQQSQTNSAELAFSTGGVSRIIFLSNILVYLAFTNQAESQGYHPQYEFSDYQEMTGVAAFYGKGSQNTNALAVSSTSSAVVDDASQKSTDTSAKIDRSKQNAGTRRCLDLMSKQTGKDYYDPTVSGDTLATWAWYCDEFFLWWQSAQAVGASWTPAQTGKGMATLGRSYLSVLQNSTDFSGGVNDGASTFRVGRYNTSCSCFPKISGWQPI